MFFLYPNIMIYYNTVYVKKQSRNSEEKCEWI